MAHGLAYATALAVALWGVSHAVLMARAISPRSIRPACDPDALFSFCRELFGWVGGTPLLPPIPIPGVNSFALFQDPKGNTIGILHPTN